MVRHLLVNLCIRSDYFFFTLQRKHIKTTDPDTRQAQIVKVARGRPSIPLELKKSNAKDVLNLASPLPLPSTFDDSGTIYTTTDLKKTHVDP